MLRPDRSIERVYLHRAPIDMRKQMDGLAALAKEVMQLEPLSGALFVFINRRRDKLKILRWEKNGFVIWYKRLEQLVSSVMPRALEAVRGRYRPDGGIRPFIWSQVHDTGF